METTLPEELVPIQRITQAFLELVVTKTNADQQTTTTLFFAFLLTALEEGLLADAINACRFVAQTIINPSSTPQQIAGRADNLWRQTSGLTSIFAKLDVAQEQKVLTKSFFTCLGNLIQSNNIHIVKAICSGSMDALEAAGEEKCAMEQCVPAVRPDASAKPPFTLEQLARTFISIIQRRVWDKREVGAFGGLFGMMGIVTKRGMMGQVMDVCIQIAALLDQPPTQPVNPAVFDALNPHRENLLATADRCARITMDRVLAINERWFIGAFFHWFGEFMKSGNTQKVLQICERMNKIFNEHAGALTEQNIQKTLQEIREDPKLGGPRMAAILEGLLGEYGKELEEIHRAQIAGAVHQRLPASPKKSSDNNEQ